MTDLNEQLYDLITSNQFERAIQLVRSGLDLNTTNSQGVTGLYPAILSGNLSLVQVMLDYGANPIFVLDEPAATVYAETPLELAQQARFLMDWDKYDPIVKLLEARAADCGVNESKSPPEGKD